MGVKSWSIACLAAGVLVLGCFAAPAGAMPESGRAAIVALGDSFISGEGGRWLGNGTEPIGTRSGTDRAALECDSLLCEYEPERVYGDSEENECHRSDVAPIESVPVAADRVNLACSGAVARDLWPAAWGGTAHFGEPPQADQLAAIARAEDVDLVLVTVGANDFGFGGLVAECALQWAASSEEEPASCHREAQAAIEAAAPAVRAAVQRSLAGVRRTMAAVGYRRGEYRLIAMGYASPFPASEWLRYPEDDWRRLTEGGCPISDADASWAAGPGIETIVGTLRAAARAVGAEFLDLRGALDGHQLCDRRSRLVGESGPTPSGSEWVRRLSLLEGTTRESLHPNAYGQRAIGACVGLQLGMPPGEYSCRSASGGGPEAVGLGAAS